MTSFSAIRSAIVRIVFAMGLGGLISCQPPAATNAASSAPRAEFRQTNAPVRDLSRDEAAGGHILRKHVGQTDEQLRERLEQERHITGASTYTDRAAPEHAVGAAIAQSQERIQSWLNRPGGHLNLVLDYDSETPIGRTMNRGENQSRPCTHALVVLKYVLKYTAPSEFYVLTSYPECRS